MEETRAIKYKCRLFATTVEMKDNKTGEEQSKQEKKVGLNIKISA